MDNVTHALAGCLLAAATVTIVDRKGDKPSSAFRTAATVVGIITAELPDSDLVYAGQSLGMGKLGYLLHHRGHTHTVLFAIGGALLVWLAVLAFRKELRSAPYKNALLGLAMVGTFSHLVLDFTNNYGVHPFWPVVNRWYYGDSVFIVEPWLWIVSIPALYAFYKSRVAHALLGFLMIVILAAAWFIGMVGGTVALALTVGAFISAAVVRMTSANRRIALALTAWFVVEGTFAFASQRSRALVVDAVGAATFRDVSLTPFIGNPFCYRALVVQVDGPAYLITDAVVAPASKIRSSSECASSGGSESVGAEATSKQTTEKVRWGRQWSAPVADLKRIVSTNCEARAAMEFIRIPQWTELAKGDVEIGDVRFGQGARGFASIVAAEKPASCPKYLPGWTPPREDLLR